MEWDAFIAVAQIVTGAGTFIVALFLAFQLVLQHRDAQRELTLDVSAQLERFRLTIGSDPSVAELWDRGRNDFEELTNQVERTQFYFLASTYMNHFAILEDFGALMKYDTKPLLFKSLATSPGVRKMYKESAMKNGLPSHFTKKVEEVVQSHEGHYVYLKEGEEQFVSGDLIARTLSGTAQEVNEKLDKLESIGVDNVALSVVGKKNALDLIEDFGRQIIQKRG